MKEALWAFCQEHEIPFLPDEPLAGHTTFHIGGKADALISVQNTRQLACLLAMLKQKTIPFFVLGQGSNLLVGDGGVRGAVIRLDRMRGLAWRDGLLIAEAGALLGKVCREAAHAGKGGLAFAYGIPGSVGGALRMNAGAYGGAMADVVDWAECMDPDGQIRRYAANDLRLSYRHSRFCDEPGVILRVAFRLNDEPEASVLAQMKDFMNRRKEKQPLEFPSAGSVFKRPEGHFAGALIETCGLKGLAVGDACVSSKHAGFIVNTGHATAADVRGLIALIREKVYAQTGVLLEPEVLSVGEE